MLSPFLVGCRTVFNGRVGLGVPEGAGKSHWMTGRIELPVIVKGTRCNFRAIGKKSTIGELCVRFEVNKIRNSEEKSEISGKIQKVREKSGGSNLKLT